jgi:hypothetical protein
MNSVSADMMALSALVTSFATLCGVIVQLVNSFRNTKKIDATHDIAVQTLSATGRIYIPPKIDKEG